MHARTAPPGFLERTVPLWMDGVAGPLAFGVVMPALGLELHLLRPLRHLRTWPGLWSLCHAPQPPRTPEAGERGRRARAAYTALTGFEFDAFGIYD